MAWLDRDHERVVLRIVYDGPARAGKTTSVRSLAGDFGRPVFSSEGADGRTLHFDWMEYQGGRFEQLAVCCQVVTVPGQEALAARRAKLLEAADAIVFVVGSEPAELEAGLRSMGSLRSFLAERPEPLPGLILQANKRDLAAAVPLVAIRERLTLGSTVGVTETVAADGTGVRQTFVFAVRLALDRLVELRRRGELRGAAVEVESARALLANLERLGVDPPPERRGAAPAPPPPPAAPPPADDGQPVLPGADVPIGCVWPPIEGRLMLHEVAGAGLRLERRASGECRGVGGRWRAHSAAPAVFADGTRAREALLEWARWHAALRRHLSPRRSVALGGGPAGTYRLWQVLFSEASLAQRLSGSLAAGEPPALGRELLEAAEALRAVHAATAAAGLPIGLDTVGLLDGGPAYVGLAPLPGRAVETPPLDLRAVFAPWLEREREALAGSMGPLLAGIEEVGRSAGLAESGRTLAELLLAGSWRAPSPR